MFRCLFSAARDVLRAVGAVVDNATSEKGSTSGVRIGGTVSRPQLLTCLVRLAVWSERLFFESKTRVVQLDERALAI